jgi:septal ring factor EnvC (AmiA/AmiB activator)
MKKRFLQVGVLLCLFLPPALSAEEGPSLFSSVNDNLDQLENLIADTLINNEELLQQLRDLKQNSAEQETILNERERLLAEKERSLAEQGRLLTELRRQLTEMSQTYREQARLSAKYASSSKFWKTFTLVAIPVTVIISGGITALVMASR